MPKSKGSDDQAAFEGTARLIGNIDALKDPKKHDKGDGLPVHRHRHQGIFLQQDHSWRPVQSGRSIYTRINVPWFMGVIDKF